MDKKAVLLRLNEGGVHPDRVIKSQGHFKARFFYFYRMGRTAEGYGAKVGRVAGARVISVDDCWHAWPTESYFEVVFDMGE